MKLRIRVWREDKRHETIAQREWPVANEPGRYGLLAHVFECVVIPGQPAMCFAAEVVEDGEPTTIGVVETWFEACDMTSSHALLKGHPVGCGHRHVLAAEAMQCAAGRGWRHVRAMSQSSSGPERTT